MGKEVLEVWVEREGFFWVRRIVVVCLDLDKVSSRCLWEVSGYEGITRLLVVFFSIVGSIVWVLRG